MPATYAHWRFGKDCIEVLPKDLKKIAEENRTIYDYGVHGPDVFFYDLGNSEVVDYGYNTHTVAGRVFFENAKITYNTHGQKEKMMAYLLGFISHYTLDSQCHSYVERKKEVSGLSHNRIETEWEAHNIRLDNRSINLVDRAEFLKYNKDDAEIMSYFYPFDEKIVYRSMKKQHLIISMMNCISDTKRKLLESLLIKINLSDYRDLIMDLNEKDDCKDSNLRLDKYKEKALKLYPKLVQEFIDYLFKDKKLSIYFNHNFDKWDDYQKLPILRYEEELKYKLK